MANTDIIFGLSEYHAHQGCLVLECSAFDFDKFSLLGELIVQKLSASIIERQQDADLHSWLIDFEGCLFFLKAEHYSESLWLEALQPEKAKEECDFLAQLLARGF
ncbi:DUF3630 family protein [Vibrio sp. FNV 38]|nr:DUF3630 family protein [Vibrio sp. FNV 38]